MCAKLALIKIPFAPETQGLDIHWIRIWREDEAVDQIISGDEIELEAAGDSRVVARLRIEDLRVDDRIDVAYTTTSNTRPVENRFSHIHPVSQQVPILDWHLTAISPSDRKLESKCSAGEMKPTVRELSEGSQYYHWEKQDASPSSRVADCPAWHQPNPELQLSNYASWSEVASEVNSRWKIAAVGTDSKQLVETIVGDASGGASWESARLLTRFVQDKIATNDVDSQGAASPIAELLESEAGDAKDKACLLVTLLRSIGIPTAPVLVSKKRTRSLRHALPSADYFDHVIVRGRIDDQDFWVDPCATHQGGSVKSMTLLPPYGFGLQISAKTKNLCAIPAADREANSFTTTEHFITREDGGAKLSVTLRAKGTEANSLRASIANAGVSGAAAARLESLHAVYPSAISTGEPTTEEDEENNDLVLREEFDIPDLFPGDTTRFFTPHSIRSKLTAPPVEAAGLRDHPWALDFPCNLRHHIVIDSQWAPGDEEVQDSSPGTAFAFSFRSMVKGKRHTLSYAYEALADHIVPVDFASVRMRLDKLREFLSYPVIPPGSEYKKPEQVEKHGKGRRIVNSDTSTKALRERERKSGPKGTPGFLKPVLAVAAALVLFVVVKGALNDGINEKSKEILATKESLQAAEKKAKAAEIAANPPAPKLEPEAAPEKIFELPDNPLDYEPPPPLIEVPDLDVGFDSEGNTSRGGDPRTKSTGISIGE